MRLNLTNESQSSRSDQSVRVSGGFACRRRACLRVCACTCGRGEAGTSCTALPLAGFLHVQSDG